MPPLHMSQARATTIANRLLREHGLADKGWTFGFDNAVRRAGQCRYNKRVTINGRKVLVPVKKITLSRKFLANATYLASYDTILHEVAHALTEGHHHDNVWRRVHIELGGNGQRCAQAEEMVREIPARYVAKCATCKTVYTRHRKPTRESACTLCCNSQNRGKYTKLFALTYTDTQTRRTVVLTPA